MELLSLHYERKRDGLNMQGRTKPHMIGLHGYGNKKLKNSKLFNLESLYGYPN